MVAITVRDVSPQARNTLASRAAASGRSMQEYLRSLLEDAASIPTQDEVVDQIRANAQTFPPLSWTSVTDDLTAERR